MTKTAAIEFTQDEFDDLIYAAREAHIRFKRARTEMNRGNPHYQMFDIDSLNADIAHYTAVENSLREKYAAAFGETW